MIDEILRDDVTKPEKIEFGNLPSKELLPDQDKIVNYIQGFKHIHNKKNDNRLSKSIKYYDGSIIR
ncbi:hypothetical protein ACO2FN_12665 [Staphylococcus epidermidis]